MEQYFQSHVHRKVKAKGAAGSGKGKEGESQGAAEKYLWHQREEIVMSTKGNHGYELQGITPCQHS